MKKSRMWLIVGAMAAFAGGCGLVVATEPMTGPSPEQQAAPQEQAIAETSATPRQVSPEQQAAAEKLGLPVVITNSIGVKLVLIPAGEFMMGAPQNNADRIADSGPQHRVRITKPFYLGLYEVSRKEYDAVTGSNPSSFKPDDLPIQNVNWEQSVEFCRKLSAREDRMYRLPTEAEWEYACRCGHTTRYSFGDEPGPLADHGWFRENSAGTVHSVGKKLPSAWGLFDMHGNLWEWCLDWYGEDYYAKSPMDDPSGPATGFDRVGRGGSWDDHASELGAAFRCFGPPSKRYPITGFRLALDPFGLNTEPVRGGERRDCSLIQKVIRFLGAVTSTVFSGAAGRVTCDDTSWQ